MRAYWMFMTLLSYKLSEANQPPGACDYNVKIISVCVGQNVSVSCPGLDGEKVAFNLFKNGLLLKCGPKNNATNCMELSENAESKSENKSASFLLTGVSANSSGIYRCQSTTMFPPPLKKAQSVLTILVLAEGHQCSSSEGPVKVADQTGVSPLVWIVVLFSIYSVTISIVACVGWVKLRGADSQSDYMNTKPRAPRKKRGVQNPVPRYF